MDLTKTNKKPSDFESETPDFEVKLELFDRASNHNKFWYIAVYGRFIVRQWGRHGTKGQSSVHHAWSNWDARSSADALISQKQEKGYKPEANVLDRFAREVAG